MEQRSVTLPNNLRVLLHRMPSMATVSVCFYVLSGARDETPNQAGAAHMLEHMLFRGSEAFSEEDIRRAMRETGSDMNAFTAWEGTCIYARMLPEYFGSLFPVLADMVRHPKLNAADYEVERSVVQEELARQLDEPRSVMLHELHRLSFDDRMGGILIGSKEQIRDLELQELRAFHRSHYVPDNTLVIITGAYEEKQIEEALTSLEDWRPGADGLLSEAVRQKRSMGESIAGPEKRTSKLKAPLFRKGAGIWGWRLPPLQGAEHYTAHLLCTLLGDDNTLGSRFETVLVRARIAEQANAVYTSFSGGGMLKIYGTFPAEHEEKFQDVVMNELRRLHEGKGDPGELRRAKNKIKTQLAVDASTTDSRMISMAQAWLPGREMVTLQEVLERIDALTDRQLAKLAGRLLAEPPFRVIAGPPEHAKLS
ncbi:insulinase family protein [Paenibacillus sp. Marseille-P2973]|uniref:M16 family metallopeptidase n=1 Tax=Paenibacillus sp. Marseille-P2973 TaxID=1871032 RepID=UPI001B3996E8|nr:pitrilysin family protein [Paenibacillus sp. Marseille-P2973]MBQ4899126.1 insulinase family protein [Paenibacillus sp. Marseille-P2973]